MDNIDSGTTNKVLEALSLNMRESSMAKEISNIDAQIQTLNKKKSELESQKNQYLVAQAGAMRAAQQAKELSQQAESKVKEAILLGEKAIAARNEAEKFAALARKPLDWDTPINEAMKALGLADTARKLLNKNLNEVKIRKEELKKDGINLNLDGTNKTPTRIAI